MGQKQDENMPDLFALLQEEHSHTIARALRKKIISVDTTRKMAPMVWLH